MLKLLDYELLRFVDFFPAMRENLIMMTTSKPKVIASYETLFFPFDIYTWLFLVASVALLSFVFVVLSSFRRGENTSSAFEGFGIYA